MFGRVTPEAKRALLHALQARGEVVAMTGDGVNDTLALKDSDLGIAMGSGTPAAKSVSELVLLDNRFSTLPSVVAEGRRVIANIERVARLFVTKNAWAAVVAVLTGIFTVSYPILPRQLSVIDALTIGIPGFVLSFQPSHDPVRPGFIPRVLRFAIPAGVVMGVATMVVYGYGRHFLDLPKAELQSGATIVLIALGLWVLYELGRPLDHVRRLLQLAMVLAAIGVFTIGPIKDFFELQVPSGEYLIVIAIAVVAGFVLINLSLRAVNRYVPDPHQPRVPADQDEDAPAAGEVPAQAGHAGQLRATRHDGDMEQLQGRVGVVTGAASGIGKAVATALAAEGMKVVLSDIEQTALDAAVGELAAAGHEVLGVRTDVSSWDAVQALAAATMDHFGAVHVLHNNAGVVSRRGGRGAHARHVELGARRRPVERDLRDQGVPAADQGPGRGPHREHGVDRRPAGERRDRAVQRRQVRRGRRSRRRCGSSSTRPARRSAARSCALARSTPRSCSPTGTAPRATMSTPTCTSSSRLGPVSSWPPWGSTRPRSPPWWWTGSGRTASGSSPTTPGTGCWPTASPRWLTTGTWGAGGSRSVRSGYAASGALAAARGSARE